MFYTNLLQFAKAMHLIGMVSWMAGLFYLVRLMVYHATAWTEGEPERGVKTRQFALMEWKVYRIILMPAVIITWSFGTMMLFVNQGYMQLPWMHVKLFFVLLLTGYTHYCKGQIRKLENGPSGRSDLYYRVLNEVPTIVLVAAVFLAVYKANINFIYFLLGLTGFVGLIAWGIYAANKKGKRP